MRNPTAVFHYLKQKSYKEIRARLFSEMHSERTRDSGHKLQQGKFCPDKAEQGGITARTLMDWNKLPKEAVKSAFLVTKLSLVQPNLRSKLAALSFK